MISALDLLMDSDSTAETTTLLESNGICTIDSRTRTIFVPPEIVVGAVQSDKNAERIKFSCPKIVGDNLDLSKFSIRINFENVSSVDPDISIKDQYICEDASINEDNITFSWVIGKNAARYMGTIRFIVCAVKTDSDSNISIEWNTTVAQIPVLEGIEVDQPSLDENNKDIINQLLAITKTASDEAVKNVNSAKEQAITDIQNVSQPDKTLTVEGGIADAKATGNAISSLREDIEEITTKDYVNLLESSDVISIETMYGFPHHEYEPKKIKTINMSAANDTVYELHVRLKSRANRKYLLSTLVSVKAGVGKVAVLFYDVETYGNIFDIYGNSVTYNGKAINNSITEKTTNIIGAVGTTKDGTVTARLRFESIDKTLIAEYSEMSLIDITDFSDDIAKLNKYINMTYAERFDLKPKGVSLETKKELEKNLSESKTYTDTKITSLKQYSNYLYGKKWWAVGDSITFGARSDIDENGVRKTYATYIANRNGMVLKLDAISGRAMGVKDDRTDSFCLDGYYNNCPFDYPDYITIFLGTNDTEEVGTINSTDINTFSGGYNKVLDYLTATYPRAKIGIIPVYNLAGQTGQMTIALGEKWGVPVFNWDTHSFFYYHYQHNTVMERKQKEFMYFNGTRYEVHPNDVGYQFMSTMIESWMREL